MILFRLLFSSLVLTSFSAMAQPVKVAVFAPIYLDEAFNGNTYKLGKNSLPKNILPGLEFYNGVMLAIDSLEQEGAEVEVNIYDTKNWKSIANAFQGPELNNIGLIIASVNNQTDLRTLAGYALQRKVPFISATYPNNAGLTNHPYFVMLNSGLQAHVEGLYKYVQRTYPLENIVMVSKNGTVENYVKKVFIDLNAKTKSTKVNWTWAQLTDTFSNQQITSYIDTTKANIVLVASPLETFGVKVVSAINSIGQDLNTTIIGMPTWDGVRSLNNSTFKNVDIVYSTPFDFSRYNKVASNVSKSYRAKYYSRPSDMVYRGYEAFFHFTKLLLKHKGDLINQIADTDHTVFNQFQIEPIKLTSTSKVDYYENKKLFYITKQEGAIKSVASN